MPNPVSIIVWRDARTDPPKGQTRGVFVEFENGKLWTSYVNTVPCEGPLWNGYDDVRRWAEIPVLSDLTDEDVREAVRAFNELRHMDTEPYDVWALNEMRMDRFRAALGEKEEA